jgi:hypothetical protein
VPASVIGLLYFMFVVTQRGRVNRGAECIFSRKAAPYYMVKCIHRVVDLNGQLLFRGDAMFTFTQPNFQFALAVFDALTVKDDINTT